MHKLRVRDYGVNKVREESQDKNLFHRIYKVWLWPSSASGTFWVPFSINCLQQGAEMGTAQQGCIIPEEDKEGARVYGLSSEGPYPLPAECRGMYLVLCGSLPLLLSLCSRLKWAAHFLQSRGMLSGATWLAASAGCRFPWQSWESQKWEEKQRTSL